MAFAGLTRAAGPNNGEEIPDDEVSPDRVREGNGMMGEGVSQSKYSVMLPGVFTDGVATEGVVLVAGRAVFKGEISVYITEWNVVSSTPTSERTGDACEAKGQVSCACSADISANIDVKAFTDGVGVGVPGTAATVGDCASAGLDLTGKGDNCRRIVGFESLNSETTDKVEWSDPPYDALLREEWECCSVDTAPPAAGYKLVLLKSEIENDVTSGGGDNFCVNRSDMSSGNCMSREGSSTSLYPSTEVSATVAVKPRGEECICGVPAHESSSTTCCDISP